MRGEQSALRTAAKNSRLIQERENRLKMYNLTDKQKTTWMHSHGVKESKLGRFNPYSIVKVVL